MNKNECDCNQIINKKHCCYNVFFSNAFIKTDACPHLKIEALKGQLDNEECDSHFERERADRLQAKVDDMEIAANAAVIIVDEMKNVAREQKKEIEDLKHQAICQHFDIPSNRKESGRCSLNKIDMQAENEKLRMQIDLLKDLTANRKAKINGMNDEIERLKERLKKMIPREKLLEVLFWIEQRCMGFEVCDFCNSKSDSDIGCLYIAEICNSETGFPGFKLKEEE